MFRKAGLLHRCVALTLSWVFTASTVWAAAPPVIRRTGQEEAVHLPDAHADVSGTRQGLTASPAQAQHAASRPVRQVPTATARAHRAIEPACDCVRDNRDGTFTAFFGYRNDNDHDVALRPDVDSHFEGAHRHDARCQHEPTFQPGFSRDHGHSLGVVFAGEELIWVLRGPDGVERRATASRHSHRCGESHQEQSSPCTTFFGPKKYLRTTGAPNVYTETITVPATFGAPYSLHVKNGEADGSSRVSSATVTVNGVEVVHPSDLNQNVASLDRVVTLTPSTTLKVTLASKPGSYLTLSLCGATGTPSDTTPPTIAIAAPAANAYLATLTPALRVTYQDNQGVDLATLSVKIDAQDVTAYLSKGASEASGSVPSSAPLTPGTHTITATIKDLAGNTAAPASSTFHLDAAPPVIAVVAPAANAYLASLTPALRVSYQDDQGLDLATLSVKVDSRDVTSYFTKGASEANGVIPASAPLTAGTHTITATIKDLAGSSAAPATSTFHLDVAVPLVSIIEPAGRLSTLTPPLRVSYQDDQGLDLTTLSVKIDSQDVAAYLTKGTSEATGAIPASAPLTGGMHTITATIKDLAGNSAPTATSTFDLDASGPQIAIAAPAANERLATLTPTLRVTYQDDQGVDLATLSVKIDSQDVTAYLTRGATEANGAIPASAPLTAGTHTITATIKDLAGNSVPPATNTFHLDVAAPTIGIGAPAADAHLATLAPTLRVTYQDDQGVDLATLSVKIDSQDVTAYLTKGANEANGAIPASAPLTAGTHTITATIKDLAGNPTLAPATGTFHLDVTAPTIVIVEPAGNLPTLTPTIKVTYQDDQGVDPSTLSVMVDARDVTGYLTKGASEAYGVVPASAPLTPGMHTITATIRDLAGNPPLAPVTGTFRLDAAAPTITIATPVADAHLATLTPTLRVTYQDDQGVDPSTLVVKIDSQDVTAYLAKGAGEASGAIPTSAPLTAGTHTITATIRDFAGNPPLALASSVFHLDVAAPIVVIVEPAGYLKTLTPTIRVTYQDDQGVDLATLSVAIDGQDVTGYLSKGASEASGAIPASAPLTSGAHTITATIKDLAGNPPPAPATGTFHLDVTAPQLVITQPADGLITSAASVTVAGTVQDDSPVTVQVADQTVSCTPASGSCAFTTSVALSPGMTTITAIATDAAGNTSDPHSVRVREDRQAPVVHITSPTSGGWISGPTVEVRGTVADDTPVTVEVNGQPAQVTGSGPYTFTATVPVADGRGVAITANARDAADVPNTGTDGMTINVDSFAPDVFIDSPADSTVAATTAASVTVTGRVLDASPVAATISIGTASPLPVSVDTAGSYTITLPLPQGDGAVLLTIAATDSVGHQKAASISVVVDHTKPDLNVASPTEGAVITALPVAVTGTVMDTTATTVTVDGKPAAVTQSGWQISIDDLTQGSHTFQVVATDAAGNSTNVPVHTTVDLLGTLSVAITDPPPSGVLTRATTIVVTGTVQAGLLPSVTVSDAVATVSQQAPGLYGFSAIVGLVEGDNALTAVATLPGRSASSPTVHVTRDTVAPDLTLTTPATISPGHPGQTVATASDAMSGLAQVTISIDGAVVGTFTAPPYQVDLSVPDGAAAGTTRVVTATAVDRAGNSVTTAPRSVSITADGAIIGLVLDDTTSLPVASATVQYASNGSGTAKTDTTDADGRYNLPTGDASALLTVDKTGFTSVERGVTVVQGSGTVAVDARLTPLAASVGIGAQGGSVHAAGAASDLTVTVPAGALTNDANVRLTPISGQGLPGLLPLGWSPVAAWDLRAADVANSQALALNGMLSSSLTLPCVETAADTGACTAHWAPPATGVHLAEYRSSVHAWTLVAANLTPSSDSVVSFELPGAGSYALVVPDPVDPPLALPAPQATLPGLALAAIPATATSIGRVDPAIVSPAGGTARGTLLVSSPTTLPSGTLVQAAVSETYDLTSGGRASREKRNMDILVYRERAPGSPTIATSGQDLAPETRHAQVAITPSMSFGTTDIVKGLVHLDILSGRESVRGTAGGHMPVTVQSSASDAALSLASGALAADTAVSIARESAFSSFLPTVDGMDALAELTVDLSGEVLGTTAELSALATAASGGTLLVAKVERIDGVPHLAIVALAEQRADRVVSVPGFGLPGITEGGRYVFYRVTSPVGVVTGQTAAGNVGVRAVVNASTGPPFIAASRNDGHYALVMTAGSASLRAAVPHTSLVGTASATVGEREVVTLDIALAGAVTTATITPPDGMTGLLTSTTFDVTTSAAIQAGSVSSAGIQLFEGDLSAGKTVPLRVVLSSSGRSLSLVPYATDPKQPALKFSTDYTLTLSGLVDVYGTAVVAPAVHVRTKDNLPPVLDPELITFAMPDANGNTHITAPPCPDLNNLGVGCLYPGTNVLIINATNGVVLSLTAGNDGDITAANNANELPATINDVLMVTVTDPFGNSQTYQRTQFLVLGPDGKPTGETAVGLLGGVVRDPAGKVELRIPEGALNEPLIMKIDSIDTWDQDLFHAPPQLLTDDSGNPLAHFGSAVRIQSSKVPHFDKEAKLAFSVPQELIDQVAAAKATNPDAKVEDALFRVLQRVEEPCPDGKWDTCDASQRPVFYLTLDFGKVEGDVASGKAKIVTASYPYTGFRDGWAQYDPRNGIGGPVVSNPVGMAAIDSVYTSYAMCMWIANALIPGAPEPGKITGRVLRPTWAEGGAEPTYVGEKDAVVKVVNTNGQEVSGTRCVSLGDGRFTCEVDRFVTGQTRVQTTVGQGTYSATVYAVAKTDSKLATDPGLQALQQFGMFKNVATADIVLPAGNPPTASVPVRVVLMTVSESGTRSEVSSTVVSGTPLLIGFDAKDAKGNVSVVKTVSINGSSDGLPVVADNATSNRKVTYRVRNSASEDGLFTPGSIGAYTIVATADPSGGGAPITVSYTLRVVAAGGGIANLPDQAPRIITAETVPVADAKGVPVTAYAQMAFTEPVTNVFGNVTLRDDAGNVVAVAYQGVRPSDGSVFTLTSADEAVTAVTLIPVSGLKYKTTYTLEASTQIQDQDKAQDGTPAPKPIDCPDNSCTSSFTTFGPEDNLGSAATDMQLVGLAVLGDRAYAAQTRWPGGVGGLQQGYLRVFDLSDPTQPKDLTATNPTLVNFPLQDVAAEVWHTSQVDSGVSTPLDRKIAAVVTGSRNWYELQGELTYYYELRSTPTNLLLYDVRTDTPQLIGATSLTNSLVEGAPKRVILKGDYAFVATMRTGLQVVSLSDLVADFPTISQMQLSLDMSNAGHFVGVSNTPLTIPNPNNPAVPQQLQPWDLEVADGTLDGTSATLAYLVSNLPKPMLSIVAPFVDPTAPVWQDVVQDAKGSKITYSSAMALTTVDNRQILLIGGGGVVACGDPPPDGCTSYSGNVLAVVDVTNPRAPVALGFFPVKDLSSGIGDLLVTPDLTVIVSSSPSLTNGGSAVIVGGLTSITGGAPLRLFIAGTLANIGSRMALTQDGILVSSDRNYVSGVTTSENGVHTAALGPGIPMVSVDPGYALINENNKTVEDLKINYRVVPDGSQVKSASIEIEDETGRLLYTAPVSLQPTSSGALTWSQGQDVKATPNFITFEVRNPDGSVSAVFTGGSVALAVEPPALTDLSPMRVVVSSAPFELVLKGRGFSSGAQVGLAFAGGEAVYQATRFVNDKELHATVSGDMLSTVGAVTVTVQVGDLTSNAMTIKVVPAGLPPAPTLASIDPPQTTVGADGFWLTLHGSRFDPVDDLVFADGAGEPLTTQYISSTEVHALVPPGLLLTSGQLGFHLESRQDADIASETRYLGIFNVSGALPAVPPAIASIDPQDMPYVPSGAPTEEVLFTGQGYQPGAQVFATIDQNAPLQLQTQVKSDSQLSARLPYEQWLLRFLKVRLKVLTPYGQRETSRTVNALTPGLFFTEVRSHDQKQLTRIMPGTFYDYDYVSGNDNGRYLVDPTTGKATANTFNLDPNSLLVHVREPRSFDPATMQVALISETADGTFLDSIQKYDLKTGQPRGSMALRQAGLQYSYESAQRILAVSDAVDDGAVDMAEGGQFSPNDGKSNDQTIQTQIGGKLKIVYGGQGFAALEAKVDVCPASVRLKVPIQVFRVDGIPGSQADIEAKLEEAKKIWAQLCVELEVVGGIQTIPEQDPVKRTFGRLRNFSSAWYFFDQTTGDNVRCDGQNDPTTNPNAPAVCLKALAQPGVSLSTSLRPYFQYSRFALSQSMRDLIAAAPLAGDPLLRLIFIEDFRNPDGSQAGDQVGLAITDTGYYEQLELLAGQLRGLSPSLTGVTFVSTAQLQGQHSNGRTVAHEVAHAVVGQPNGFDDSQHAKVRNAKGEVVDDQPNILRDRWVADTSILRKRFNKAQLNVLYRSNRYVRYSR